MIKVVKPFSYNQNFDPEGWVGRGYLPLLLGYIRVVFSSVSVLPIFVRFHMGLSVEGALTICLNSFTPLNQMSAMPIYGKNSKVKIAPSSSPEPRAL